MLNTSVAALFLTVRCIFAGLTAPDPSDGSIRPLRQSIAAGFMRPPLIPPQHQMARPDAHRQYRQQIAAPAGRDQPAQVPQALARMGVQPLS